MDIDSLTRRGPRTAGAVSGMTTSSLNCQETSIEPGIEHKPHFTSNFQPTISLLTPTNHEDADANSDVDSVAIPWLKMFMQLHSQWPLGPNLHTTFHKGFFIYI
jgi:hypothetical protein